MNSFIILISLVCFTFAGYLVWPSRYNVLSHGYLAGGFISIFVPAIILQVQDNYPSDIVNLYSRILLIGAIFYLAGIISGFLVGRRFQTRFSFDVISTTEYEVRVDRITRNFLIVGIIGLTLSYIGMGFIPVFAAEPIAAKLFRGQYQEPYLRVAVLFRTSFYLISTIIPIACIVWYKNRSKLLLVLIISGLALMIGSLQRSGAFSGIVFAFIVIMSFKSRFHFLILMFILVGVFVLSSFFYYIVGIKAFEADEDIWKIIGASSPDIDDQLQFMVKFSENPIWTYGRTMYGGLIPGHYEWNPSVYTLNIIAPGRDVNEVGSGGLRLPLPLWGYVSFQWVGVVLFSLLTGIINGIFLGIVKTWILKYKSIIVKATALIAFSAVSVPFLSFTLLNMFSLPPAIIMLVYLFRIDWERKVIA